MAARETQGAHGAKDGGAVIRRTGASGSPGTKEGSGDASLVDDAFLKMGHRNYVTVPPDSSPSPSPQDKLLVVVVRVDLWRGVG